MHDDAECGKKHMVLLTVMVSVVLAVVGWMWHNTNANHNDVEVRLRAVEIKVDVIETKLDTVNTRLTKVDGAVEMANTTRAEMIALMRQLAEELKSTKRGMMP